MQEVFIAVRNGESFEDHDENIGVAATLEGAQKLVAAHLGGPVKWWHYRGGDLDVTAAVASRPEGGASPAHIQRHTLAP